AEIDRWLKEEAKKDSESRKILLLGTSESGKSTVVRQMKLISTGNLSDYREAEWRPILQGNILRGVHELLHAMAQLDISLANTNESAMLRNLPENAVRSPPTPFPEEWSEAVLTVYKDPSLKVAFERRHEATVLDNISYLFQHIPRLMTPNASISNEDILFARLETTGCSETKLNMYGLNYKVYDVPGSRSERHAWVPFFDDANVILFVVSTSSYDQTLAEDPSTNRLLEAMVVFEQVCNNPLLENTAIILFLNKIDLLASKFKAEAFTVPFPDFAAPPPGEDMTEHVLKFLAKKFYYLNHKRERKLYVHNTCATDTNQVRVVLATVNKIIIKLNLAAVRFSPRSMDA
ncbi:guanine nucleotide binding protein, alpha subunit, partial [Catenaria anguillulae PL171]